MRRLSRSGAGKSAVQGEEDRRGKEVKARDTLCGHAPSTTLHPCATAFFTATITICEACSNPAHRRRDGSLSMRRFMVKRFFVMW